MKITFNFTIELPENKEQTLIINGNPIIEPNEDKTISIETVPEIITNLQNITNNGEIVTQARANKSIDFICMDTSKNPPTVTENSMIEDLSWLQADLFSKHQTPQKRFINAWRNRNGRVLKGIQNLEDLRNAFITLGDKKMKKAVLSQRKLGPQSFNHLKLLAFAA